MPQKKDLPNPVGRAFHIQQSTDIKSEKEKHFWLDQQQKRTKINRAPYQ